MTTERNSSFELLRIIAMFLVMIVHADFMTLGRAEFKPFTIDSFELGKTFFQSLSIICVDLFIMISGWFGIHPKTKSFAGLLFQCFFFLIGSYIVTILLGINALNMKGIAHCCMLMWQNWFVKAYVLLFILSPVLNFYCEKADVVIQRNIVISFFLFQSILGWLTPAVTFFDSGYSTMSFIGLYLLMQYVKRSNFRLFHLSPNIDFLIFFSLVLLHTVSYIIFTWFSLGIANIIYSYINPFVITESLFLFLGFSKLSFKSKAVNYVAASSFAVYLLHANPFILTPVYSHIIKEIFVKNSYKGGGDSCLVINDSNIYIDYCH